MGPRDPFAVLGLPRRYDLDPVEIERRYLDRSAALHPDMLGPEGRDAVGSDPEEGGAAAELNKAREILEDPEQRAIALWKLNGGGGGAQAKCLPRGFGSTMIEAA